MAYYLDTSVLVPIYTPEKHTKSILKFIEDTKEILTLSELVEVEFYSALSLKRRTKELTTANIQLISDMFSRHVEGSKYEKIHSTAATFALAAEYLRNPKSTLRTADALHLACSALTQTTLVTADKILAANAQRVKLPVTLM